MGDMDDMNKIGSICIARGWVRAGIGRDTVYTTHTYLPLITFIVVIAYSAGLASITYTGLDWAGHWGAE